MLYEVMTCGQCIVESRSTAGREWKNKEVPLFRNLRMTCRAHFFDEEESVNPLDIKKTDSDAGT